MHRSDDEADTSATVIPFRRRAADRADRDVRGLLALMCVIGSFALSFTTLAFGIIHNTNLAAGQSPASLAEIPSWTAGIVGTVVGYYFGSRGAAGAVEQAQQGIKLDDIHNLVNSRFEEALKKIEAQRETIDAATLAIKVDEATGTEN